jgi:hypothetical protein
VDKYCAQVVMVDTDAIEKNRKLFTSYDVEIVYILLCRAMHSMCYLFVKMKKFILRVIAFCFFEKLNYNYSND